MDQVLRNNHCEHIIEIQIDYSLLLSWQIQTVFPYQNSLFAYYFKLMWWTLFVKKHLEKELMFHFDIFKSSITQIS